MTARPLWLAQQERGSRRLMRVIAKIALKVGRPAGRLLLYPICAYFILFSSRARRASRDYLRRVLGRAPLWRDIFRHYHCFASTILDRVFLLSGRFAHFDYEIEDLDALLAAISNGRGCLLVGAHFGSFEVLRVMGQTRAPVRVRILMHEQNAHKLNSVLGALNPAAIHDVITLGQPHTMLAVRDAIASGEIVGLLADRVVAGDRMVACDFLGASAPFPEGPFVLAALLRVPVILFSAACRGNGRYHIRFAPLASASTTPRDEAALAEQCQHYARWLEANCRADPYNWFNFYDFWASSPRA
jgi:predicted LPLAT superfamily acyltransferase